MLIQNAVSRHDFLSEMLHFTHNVLKFSEAVLLISVLRDTRRPKSFLCMTPKHSSNCCNHCHKNMPNHRNQVSVALLLVYHEFYHSKDMSCSRIPDS